MAVMIFQFGHRFAWNSHGLTTHQTTISFLRLFRTLALLARVHPELVVKDVELLCKFLSSQERVGGAWSKGQCEMMGTVAAIYDCVLVRS